MATKKFIIEVEEGRTQCENCPLGESGYCTVIHMDIYDCYKYNLATMKIEELEEEKMKECYKPKTSDEIQKASEEYLFRAHINNASVQDHFIAGAEWMKEKMIEKKVIED